MIITVLSNFQKEISVQRVKNCKLMYNIIKLSHALVTQ